MAANNILALDVGEVRVGLALARADVLVPVALKTLRRTDKDFWQQLLNIIAEHNVGQLIVGLPRQLEGRNSAQTEKTRQFGKELQTKMRLPITWQDEALTSLKAEEMLKQTKKPYTKADIDALAACYILDDYLESSKVSTP